MSRLSNLEEKWADPLTQNRILFIRMYGQAPCKTGILLLWYFPYRRPGDGGVGNDARESEQCFPRPAQRGSELG